MRVLVADDHALFRAGLAGLLRAWGAEVVGEAGDGLDALEQARRLRPDLVLIDVAMPGCGGLEATRLIKAELPEVAVVMVTVSDGVDDVFEALQAGAQAYLLKSMSEEDLGRTLAAVARGEAAVPAALAVRILDELARAPGDGAAGAGEAALTPREREVLGLVAGGATNREIAAALRISEHTVGYHTRNILAKLHLRNRAQAAAYAARSGFAGER